MYQPDTVYTRFQFRIDQKDTIRICTDRQYKNLQGVGLIHKNA